MKSIVLVSLQVVLITGYLNFRVQATYWDENEITEENLYGITESDITQLPYYTWINVVGRRKVWDEFVNDTYECGATILDVHWIATAGHCVIASNSDDGIERVGPVSLTMGVSNLDDEANKPQHDGVLPVADLLLCHPEYSSKWVITIDHITSKLTLNDLCFLRVDHTLPTMERVSLDSIGFN